ncbi:MAG TPA: hypothetical protein VE988_23050 [Gemmataceae bacterium]|nr:hypothetical protein [Gemmataceae bacterium]
MTRKRLLVGAAVMLVLATAGTLTLFGFGLLSPATDYRPVPPGHQEIVFLAPATSGEAWERLVAAVDVLHQESLKANAGTPRLNVFKQRAFTDLTADVPEVAIWPDGFENAKLWIRWYKLSSGHNTESWISSLTERPTPPLAVIGGDTSHRALRVGEALERHRKDWQAAAPLFFITTATADRYIPNNTPNVSTIDERWPKLIDVYKGRSFRFSFTNSRMAAAVLDFVQSRNELWPALKGKTNLYTLRWDDDSFSADLADRFDEVFLAKFPNGQASDFHIEYSGGDFFQPNPREAFVVGQILPELKEYHKLRQFMLLPADADRARRFLRTVVRRSDPADLKNLIVMTGDSLGFNTIFRDRNVSWNIQDLPVPLVMFSHRNPVSKEVGFDEASASGGTGTEDLLLYRDILETVLLTAYQGQKLTASSDDLIRGLRELCWSNGRVQRMSKNDKTTPLFNPGDGNRSDGTGEHIIVLLPDLGRGVPQATIAVWNLESKPDLPPVWEPLRKLTVTYDAQLPDRPDI